MGEWLADTLEAAQFTAQKMEQARAAPRIVAREMHAYALGLTDETGSLIESLRAVGRTPRRQAQRDAEPAGDHPPSGNTGGKGPSDRPTASPRKPVSRSKG